VGLMTGKRGIIMGVANEHSLAWGIAKSLNSHGAELAFSYQGNIFEKRVKPLAESIGSKHIYHCDVSEEGSVEEFFDKIDWDGYDFIVHSMAYSDKNELRGMYMDTSKSNFTTAMAISCYSFTHICRVGAPRMRDGGGMITLTYYGSEKVLPHYNVMGVAKAALEASVRYLAVDLGPRNIRVNAICSGPVKTLASSGIKDMRLMLKWNKYNSPLKRNTTLEDIGGTAVFLLSDLSSGVTGEVIHTDSGYHVMGMKSIDAPDITLEDTVG
jgi:enoyl-[acyl-carrier protein] reductase I